MLPSLRQFFVPPLGPVAMDNVLATQGIAASSGRRAHRISLRGKFLFADEEKFFVKGVSYGAFRPDAQKREYWNHAQIDRDFAQMAASGINTVRIPHTVPPRALLDCAQEHGLRGVGGLSAGQCVGFLVLRAT